MRILKAAVLGLAIAGFGASTALACGMGSKKEGAQTTIQDTGSGTGQTTVTNDRR